MEVETSAPIHKGIFILIFLWRKVKFLNFFLKKKLSQTPQNDILYSEKTWAD